MLPNEVFRNILFDDRRKSQLSGGSYCEGNLKMYAWSMPVRVFPFLLQLLHIPGLKGLNDLSTCWVQHCGSISSVLMDGLRVGMTSCESESTDSLLFLFFGARSGLWPRVQNFHISLWFS